MIYFVPFSISLLLRLCLVPIFQFEKNETAVACSASPEAVISLDSFTESLSIVLGFLARANRLTAQTVGGRDDAFDNTKSGNGRGSKGRRLSQGRRQSSRGARRRSSIGGRRRSLMGGAGDPLWTVPIDLGKLTALLTMLKTFGVQDSPGHLMNAGNHVRVTQTLSCFVASCDTCCGVVCIDSWCVFLC